MINISRRKFVASAGALAAASAFPMPALAANTIKIGAVQPFSGGLELFGKQAQMGLDLAAAEINAAGGIMGSKVEVLYEDNK
ncbi:MAG: ABC transporter substrate-binding protein, partial [Sneathiellales bacterium]|nr:ABC transporter substrate-binding protein [Sneathiellales bacterium]